MLHVLCDIPTAHDRCSRLPGRTLGRVLQLGFGFGALELQYTPQDPTGKAGAAVVGGWDVTKNVKI